jgi:uncharacterized protein YjbJ (UPF0337 family)
VAVTNWDQIKGDWHQLNHRLQEKWKLLTDSDLKSIAGKRDRLEDILRDRYGYEKIERRSNSISLPMR